jgi:hypothetical protein
MCLVCWFGNTKTFFDSGSGGNVTNTRHTCLDSDFRFEITDVFKR